MLYRFIVFDNILEMADILFWLYDPVGNSLFSGPWPTGLESKCIDALSIDSAIYFFNSIDTC